jgi:hypothetical protein
MAWNGSYTTVNRVLDDIERKYGLNVTAVYPDAIEHLSDIINSLGISIGYEQHITNGVDKPIVEVTNYRGILPCGIIEIQQIRDYDTKKILLPSTNTFHRSSAIGFDDTCDGTAHSTYRVNENYIFTDCEEINLEIAYLSLPFTDEGELKIPDNQRYVNGLSAYVAERLAFKKFLSGEITQTNYEYIAREAAFYVKSARNGMLTPDIPQAENLKNMRIKLIVNSNNFATGFKYIASPSNIKI